MMNNKNNQSILENRDPLLEVAAKLFLEKGQVSTSLLARELLNWDFARSMKIMSQLETAKIISPAPDKEQKKLLINDSEELEIVLQETDTASMDPLFNDAARFLVKTGQATVSSLRRELLIGYNRAEKIIDQLEAAKIINTQKVISLNPRKLLVSNLEEIESILKRI